MRFWLALTGALIFAAGAAVGFAVSHGIRPAAPAGAPPISEAFLDAPAFVVQGKDVYDGLDLTADQRQSLDGLLAHHYREVRRIRSSMAQVVTDLIRGVEALLTSEQRERFRQVQIKYTEREVQLKVRHEILSLATDLDLSPEQEGRAYLILFDAELARRETFRSCREKEKQGEDVSRDQMRGLMGEISARRDASLQEVFSPDQWASYRERKDRERKLWKRGPDKGPE